MKFKFILPIISMTYQPKVSEKQLLYRPVCTCFKVIPILQKKKFPIRYTKLFQILYQTMLTHYKVSF